MKHHVLMAYSQPHASNRPACNQNKHKLTHALACAGAHAQPHPKLPWLRVAELAGLWAVFLGLQLLKSQHHRCEPAYSALFAVQALIALGTGSFFTWQVLTLLSDNLWKQDLNCCSCAMCVCARAAWDGVAIQ